MHVSESVYKKMPPNLRAMFCRLPNPGSDSVVGLFPETVTHPGVYRESKPCKSIFGAKPQEGQVTSQGGSGSAARFFYAAKASKEERGKGNVHPTVKPLALMSYLCKLVASPGYSGVLLDPFMGSGSTLLAASRWFERVVGIEQDEKSCEIAAERLRQGVLF